MCDRTQSDQGPFCDHCFANSKEPACLYSAMDKDLPLGFPGHLLLKMGLFSLPLWQGNTEELEPDLPLEKSRHIAPEEEYVFR